MGVETHKAEVVPVKLLPHPNADKLSIVRVYNFTVVVNTADWQGVEKAVYIQPDSVLPDKPEHRWLKENGNHKKEREALWTAMQADHESDLARLDYADKIANLEARIDTNTKSLRITVKKLRGVISMGMLVPAPEGMEIGQDAAEVLGITHYEPPMISDSKGDDVASAPPMIYAPKYDVESIYKFADCFEAGEMVYVSEKLDGQNGRYVSTLSAPYKETSPAGFVKTVEDYTFHAGSRTEWKKKEGNSNWWRAIQQNPWIETWMISHPEIVMYGEVFGWVAALRYGAQQGQLVFRAFDVLEGMEYWDAEYFLANVPEEHRVPTLGVMPFDFEKLQALADGPSLIKGANHMREGIVVKPMKERKHWSLGRVMLKMVSNAYLEKSSR